MIAALSSRLRAFRPAPGLVPWLPGSSRLYGPPRRALRAADLDARQARVLPLTALERVRLAEPRWLGPEKTHWFKTLPSGPPPPAFVLEARHARLLSPGAAPILIDDTWVTDCGFTPWSPTREAFRHHALGLRKKPRPLLRLPGRTLSLACDFAAHSYGHWLIDSITRWALVEAAGLGSDDFDRVYIPCPGPVARRLAGRLPIPADKLLFEPAGGADLECEVLFATSHPGWPGYVPAFASPLLRRLVPPAPGPSLRLAILRDGFRRNFSNRDELYPLLRERGFALVDPRSASDLPELCARAEAIVSIEGSQAYDMLFAPAGSRALIVASPAHHTFPYPQSAAGSAGLDLLMLEGSSLRDGAPDTADFTVPPDLFARALDELLAPPPRSR